MQSAGVGKGAAYARIQVSSTCAVRSKPIRFITDKIVAPRFASTAWLSALFTHWNHGKSITVLTPGGGRPGTPVFM